MCKGLPTVVPAEDDGPPPVMNIGPRGIDMDFAKEAIKTRLQQMADATSAHMRAADVEASKSKQMHALTRHGFQTGWAGQLLRICTKLTPDQEYDPLGILPIESKPGEHKIEKSVFKKGIATGEVKMVKVKSRTGGGVAAGLFYNPEIQDDLMKRSLAMARTAAKSFPECSVCLQDGSIEWRPYKFIHVHLTRIGGSGVAFAKAEGWVKKDAAVVVKAINDFMNSTPLVPGKRPPRFPRWKDLLEFLNVTQILRNGSRTEICMGDDPCVMTMMPETVASGQDGFAPTSIAIDKADRTRFQNCRWTGGLRDPASGGITTKAVPSWAEPFK